MALVFPKPFREWPQEGRREWTTNEVIVRYQRGFAGCGIDKEAEERFADEMQWPNAEDALTEFGLAGSGEGKLCLTFPYAEQVYGKECMPGPGQTRGDCVSHGCKNACLWTHCAEIVAGLPDEVSGLLEARIPGLTEEGIRNGVLSSEAIYWWRRHGGDGWSCGAASSVVVNESGMWPRTNYTELGIDLTKYSGSTAGKWGRTTPPENILNYMKDHRIRTSTRINSAEALRDLIYNGYGVQGCGGQGFSKQRNEDGVSTRSGSWSHAMGECGFDDRAATKSKYGGPLVLILNSWGKWNSGPRKIMGTDIEIPEGSFWARWKDVSSRDRYAFSGAAGWPVQKFKDWGTTGWD